MKLQQLSMLLALSLGFAPMLLAQDIPKPEEEIPSISPDRPGWGDGSSVLPKNTAILEIGFYFDQTLPKLNYRGENINYISGLVRWGILKNFELRFGLGGGNTARVRQKKSNNVISKVSGYQPIQFGTKIQIAKGDGWKPEVAFIGMITLPWVGKKEFRPETVAPMVRFSFSHPFSERFALGYNLGMDWDGSQGVNWFATLGLDINVVEGLAAFVEGVSWIDQDFGNAEVGVNGGFVYVLKDIIQFDLSAGYTYNTADNAWWFAMAGFSWRFPK